MAASIVKTIQIRVLATPDDDPTTATVVMDRWLFIETYSVIITSSIPCIRSLVVAHRRKRSDNSQSFELGSSPYATHPEQSRRSFTRTQTATNASWRYRKQDEGDRGSKDSILRADSTDNEPTSESGIVKRVEITVDVGPSSTDASQNLQRSSQIG